MGILLIWEKAWTDCFSGMRNGLAEVEIEVPGGESGAILLKGTDEEGNRILRTWYSGEEQNYDVKLATEPGEIHQWAKNAQREETEFDQIATFEIALKIRQPAIPAERRLFDALLEANDGAVVRRICRRSKRWLRYRWDFGNEHFFESPWPCPRALYEHAYEFCRAKLDPRYPARDERASGDVRRIKYLARVMAGLSLPKPISPSYAVELLRKKKYPKVVCPNANWAFPFPPIQPSGLIQQT
jgi:hypothetical protein